jgi:polyisoprenyl-phosphate glycosyltransferase
VRHERFAGESKYPLKKMLKLALDGITSFSFKPLFISGYLGCISLFIGLISLIWIFIKHIISNSAIINFGFLLSINLMMFGIVLICMGIIGQYIGRIFDESKNRPNYIIESIINKDKVSDEHESFN